MSDLALFFFDLHVNCEPLFELETFLSVISSFLILYNFELSKLPIDD